MKNLKWILLSTFVVGIGAALPARAQEDEPAAVKTEMFALELGGGPDSANPAAKVGKEGVITVEEATTKTKSAVFGEMQSDRGYLYFVTDKKRREGTRHWERKRRDEFSTIAYQAQEALRMACAIQSGGERLRLLQPGAGIKEGALYLVHLDQALRQERARPAAPILTLVREVARNAVDAYQKKFGRDERRYQRLHEKALAQTWYLLKTEHHNYPRLLEDEKKIVLAAGAKMFLAADILLQRLVAQTNKKEVPHHVESITCLLSRGRLPYTLRPLHQTKEVERGQVLAKPGSITPHKKFKAEAYILTKEEGERYTPFFNGYRPQFYFRTTDATRSTELPGNITHDGGRTVAAGVEVTKVSK